MQTIRFLLYKEFLQIFRNRVMLPILFIMPVVQLLVLSFAATYELKEVHFVLVDLDHSPSSRDLSAKFQASGYFALADATSNIEEAITMMDRGEIRMILTIPQNFHRDITIGRPAPVQLMIDAVDGVSAGLIQSYSGAIIRDFNSDRKGGIFLQTISQPNQQYQSINVIPVYWYNPDLNYINFMVPGILVVLVTMIGVFLSGMNIVREKEIGTIEQLNVTPIRKYQFITGKLIPFWIIGMVDLLIGLALARYGFNIPFLGSLWLILAVAGIYLVLVQSVGLLISTITSTQQQAMFIAWFMMVIFILMGGLFTPIESMPVWAQNLTLANPVAWFIKIMRMVLLKGAGWYEIKWMVLLLTGMAAFFIAASINRYNKTSS
ncbi:MAG: ABC transporter permease [Balneolaceae bacterium]|nr:MAG: ABC transporter permease [Balneolaceae bacterium]